MGLLFAWLSAAVNIITAFLIVGMFFSGWTSFPLPAFDVPLLSNGYLGLASYMSLNTLSGKLRPAGFFYRWVLDFGSSFIAAVVIWGTFLAVHLNWAHAMNFAQAPGAYQLLIALSGAAFVDILFNQLENAKEAFATVTGKPYTAPTETTVAGATVRSVTATGMFAGATIHQLNEIDCAGRDVVIHPAPVGHTARIEILDPGASVPPAPVADPAPSPRPAAPPLV